MPGTLNCCWQSRDFPGIVGEPSENSSPGSRGAARARLAATCVRTCGAQSEASLHQIDVEIRKYGVTIGCSGCMAITVGRTAQEHSDECRARIEQDVTGEGAMRLEGAIMRKRARPDDGSGRADVAVEVAAKSPIRPVQYGGSSSLWEVRPEPSRRRDTEEQLGGDVVRARLQDLRVLCVQQRRRGYSCVKSSRPLWTRSLSTSKSWVRCTWQNRTSGRFLARAFGEVGERLQRAPRCACGPAV